MLTDREALLNDSKAKSARKVIDELHAWGKRWEDGEQNAKVGCTEPVNPGHPIHSAVVALESLEKPKRHGRRTLPTECSGTWRRFLHASRSGVFAATQWQMVFEMRLAVHYLADDEQRYYFEGGNVDEDWWNRFEKQIAKEQHRDEIVDRLSRIANELSKRGECK